MTFTGVKCDECRVMKGESNHWLQIAVHFSGDTVTLIALGDVHERMGLHRQTESHGTNTRTELHDLCGQSCALRHVAKLLGWSSGREIERSAE